jgi:membrane protein implicated in regulation of membrane protease activity
LRRFERLVFISAKNRARKSEQRDKENHKKSHKFYVFEGIVVPIINGTSGRLRHRGSGWERVVFRCLRFLRFVKLANL